MIASLAPDFAIIQQGKVIQVPVRLLSSWGESAYAFTEVDVLGRSHDLGGLLQTDHYSDAGVWVSEDGSAWEEQSDLPFPGSFDEWAVAATTFGDDLVVVGSWRESGTEPTQVQNMWTFPTDDLDGAVWLGAGATGDWARIDDPDLGGDRDEEIVDVVAIGGVLVAVGSAQVVPDFGVMELPVFDGAAWTSTDGTDWARVEDPDGLFSGPGISTAFDAAVTDGTTAWAFGVDQGGAGDELAVWTTGDGSDWQRAEITGEGISTSQNLVIADATLSPAGMVVVGSEFGDAGRFPAAWFSPDGITWERVDPGTLLEGELAAVATTEFGFVAVGHTQEDRTVLPLVLLSGDGRHWSEDTGPLPGVEDAARATLTTVGIHQGVVMAAGTATYLDDSREVLIWSGEVRGSGA
ncbi:MAG: hypothetical protein KJ956_06580 [Actinobacteria bacterium]|nr:hypothetical protein [Actinomycetota bacterium]